MAVEIEAKMKVDSFDAIRTRLSQPNVEVRRVLVTTATRLPLLAR